MWHSLNVAEEKKARELKLRKITVLATLMLTLFLRRENWALVFGVVSSVLFGLFYGFLVIAPIFIVVRLLCLVIVILNAVSVFFLEIENENREKRK